MTAGTTGSSYRPSEAGEPDRLATQASVRSPFDLELIHDVADQVADTSPSPTSGLLVADLGCADGTLTRTLFDHSRFARVVGIDADPTMADPDQQDWPVLHGDAADPADAARLAAALGEPADIVHAALVIQHVDDPHALLAAAHQLLRPGGALVISAPDDQLKAAWPDDGTLDRIVAATATSPAISDRSCSRKLPAWLTAAGFAHVRPHAQVVTTALLDAAGRRAVADTNLSWRADYLARAAADDPGRWADEHNQLAGDCGRLHRQVCDGDVDLLTVELRFTARRPRQRR